MKTVLALSFLSLTLLACAKVDEKLPPTAEITKTTYCYKPTTSTTSCSVAFYSQPGSILMLEDEAVVAWNGNRSSIWNNHYYTTFSDTSYEAIQLTVVRPEAGATTVEFIDIQ